MFFLLISKNMKLIKIFFTIFIVIILLSKLSFSEDDFLDYKLNVLVNTDNNISTKNVADNEIIKGTLSRNTTYGAIWGVVFITTRFVQVANATSKENRK